MRDNALQNVLLQELHAQTEQTKRRQARKEERRVEKMKNPIALSKYKYEAPEIEIKAGLAIPAQILTPPTTFY